MSARGVARVGVVGIVLGLLAALGEVAGLAVAWAVIVGVAVAVAGSPPVVFRGFTVLVGAIGGIALLRVAGTLVDGGVDHPAVVGLTAGTLMVAAGLLRLHDDERLPAWALLVGGGATVAGAQLASSAAVLDLVGVVTGLVLGLVPAQVGEVVDGVRRARRTVTEQPGHTDENAEQGSSRQQAVDPESGSTGAAVRLTDPTDGTGGVRR